MGLAWYDGVNDEADGLNTLSWHRGPGYMPTTTSPADPHDLMIQY